jgi:LruC domain-containing protein
MPVRVPALVSELFVEVHTMGVATQQTVNVVENIQLNFGGNSGKRAFTNNKNSSVVSRVPIKNNYYYMGSFTSGQNEGVPNYLEPVGDVVSQNFLNDVNASLPERQPVPDNNPNYLTVGNELDIVVNSSSDVWVTMVAEGAGYRNALGYYVFDSNNPPATVNDIDSIFVVLPNSSLKTSGGGLFAGDKVRLGTFEGGKTISWVLFQNAWTSTGLDVDKVKYYSRIDFNTMESDPTKRQHTVQLVDIGRQLLLNGFEDQTRSVGSDNDFNDLVFYVTANPWENVDISGIPSITPQNDCDNDGVSDESDDFVCDPLRAVRNTYNGTLAYEDLWPAQGDYDFNDMVIDYEIDHILNGANEVVEIEADWTVRAVGAGFRNGFAYSFDQLAPNTISSITGQDLSAGLVSVAGNGTEQGQSNATVVAFDNVFNVMPNAGTAFINTVAGEATANPVTLSNKITFTSSQNQSLVGLPPYNAFIFANATRGREIHLSDKAPTDLADQSLFGTDADATDAGNEYYYKTANGLPWAINIAENFAYPTEYSPINEAYSLFSVWATSGGALNTNWFTDEAGNRNNAKIY